jgi:hypothetical protein
MKSRGVVGKKIVRIEQRMRALGEGREPENCVDYIELEDGTKLWPYTIEQVDGYSQDFVVTKPGWTLKHRP